MADPRHPSLESNFQQFRPPGPQPPQNFSHPPNQQFPGAPPKMPGVVPGPPGPGQFNTAPPPSANMHNTVPGNFPPQAQPPTGPPQFGGPMPPRPRMPPVMGGPRPPVNGFTASPMHPPGPGNATPPGVMSGPPPPPRQASMGGGNIPGGAGAPFNPQISQGGQVVNGPTSAQTMNGGQMGPPPMGIPQGPHFPPTQTLLQGAPQPLRGPPSGFRPPGPPPQVGGPPRGPPGQPPATSGAPPQGPPPMRVSGPGHPASSVGPPPTSAAQGQVNASRPNELPVPYHGHAQYSHQVGPTMKLTPGLTPSHSDPPSQKSSRAPSPIENQSYDAMEGQFSPQSVGSPPAMTAPPSQGITGRRQYPQMPANAMPPPPVSQGYQGGAQGYQANTHPGYQTGAPHGIQPNAQPQGYQPGPPTSQPGYQPQQQGYGTGTQYPSGPGPMSGPQGVGGYQQIKPGQGQANNINPLMSDFSNMGMNDNQRVLNLMQERHLIPSDGLETVKPGFQHDFKKINCSQEIFRCTVNAIPQTSSLLNKARLPLGIIIHPFKDLSQLPVIQSSVIVRCRSCRTYINPFVHFVDQRRWKCNLCYRVNELPEEFSFDPVSKTYGDPQRRPEVRSATIEFIAPSEYMLRPPQPAVYVFLLDVSFNAIETGYLQLFCQILLDELDKIPGDARTQVAFLAYDCFLYFFGLAEGQSQPQMMVVPDLEDIFLPCPDNLLVNLNESKDLVIDLLNQLPVLFQDNRETGSALGAALQASFKLVSGSGGRVTVMQTVLPTVGPGALQTREVSGQASSKNVPHLGPATDFYKKMALDCSAQQVSVDLFMLNGQYADLATLTCVSKYSAGCVYYYPSFHTLKTPELVDRFDADFRRYLTRKIGFEAVMRIRCTRGLSIHTFHGNFFVRSTDLLSLPNINPDAGFGMQMSIEDNLTETTSVCFQAALLYTSSKGERRIRVHTLCLPVTNQLSDVFASADQQAIICLLAKMAVDRSVTSSMSDARDALINAALDPILAYSSQIPASQRMGALPLPFSLRVLPLYILAMLKSSAFRQSANIKLDDRVFALLQCKTLPMPYLMQAFYPHLYPVHSVEERNTVTKGGLMIPKLPLLQLSSANIDRHGAYLMDCGICLYLLIGGAVSDQFCQDILDKPNFMSIPEGMNDLPENENPASERLRNFINYLMDSRPFGASILVLREDSKTRHLFFQHMVEDKTESSMSYYEFLQYLQQRTKS